MNKKGWHDVMSWISLPVGIILLVMGIIPLLQSLGVIGFGLPGFLAGAVGTFIPFIIAAAALFLIIDSFLEDISSGIGLTTAIVGLIILVLGVIVALNSLGVIGFSIPFLSMLIYNIIFIILGILAILAAFVMI